MQRTRPHLDSRCEFGGAKSNVLQPRSTSYARPLFCGGWGSVFRKSRKMSKHTMENGKAFKQTNVPTHIMIYRLFELFVFVVFRNAFF